MKLKTRRLCPSDAATVLRVSLLALLLPGINYAQTIGIDTSVENSDVAARARVDLSVEQLHTSSWGSDDGLPSDRVFDLLQTRDGYLWIGTDEGLVRFDGVRFHVFNQTNTSALASNTVIELYETGDGTLWAGTEGGGLTAFRVGRHRPAESVAELSGVTIKCLLEDSEGELWVGTETKTWRSQDGRFDIVSGAPENVTTMAVDSSGTVWFGGKAGLRRWNGEAAVTSGIDELDSGEASPAVNVLVADRDGSLWAGTEAQGLLHVDQEVLQRYLPNSSIQLLFQDRHGRIWYAGRAGKLKRLDDGPADDQPWYGAPVECMTDDSEGGLWLGAIGSPHALQRLTLPPATSYDHLAACVLARPGGGVWLGSNAGLSRVVGNGDEKILTIDRFYRRSRALALAPGRNGSLWIGRRDKWIDQWSDDVVTPFQNRDRLRKEAVAAVFEDTAGTVWVGYRDGGASRREEGQDKFVEIDQFGDVIVNWFAEVTDGDLYVGTSDGLYRGTARVNDPVLDELPTTDFRSHHVDENGDLWLGTVGGGLLRLRDGVFTNWSTQHGLRADRIFAITDDSAGNLWLGALQKVFFVSKANLEDVAGGKTEKLKCRTTPIFGDSQRLAQGYPKMARSADGSVWVTRKNDTVRVPPGAIDRNPVFAPVHIEHVHVDGDPLSGEDEVEFYAGTRRLAIYYTAATHANPAGVEFKYRLTGHADNWIETGGDRVAYFTELPPGKYSFHVIGTNGHGLWNEDGASISIIIKPRWFETAWFKTMFVIGLCGFVAACVTVFTARVRLRNAALQKEVTERKLAEEELLHHQQRLKFMASELMVTEERERRRIAADLHDHIGQTLALARIQLASVRKATPDRETDRKLEELSDSMLQATQDTKNLIFDLSSPTLSELGLGPAVSEWLEEQVGRKHGLHTEFKEEGETQALNPDLSAILFRNVRELLTNVIKHAQASEVMVSLCHTEGIVTIVVADDGIGFAPGVESGAARSMGFGLFSIRERMANLGGSSKIESQPGEGCAVTLIAPLNPA